jgi:hypothetical protein
LSLKTQLELEKLHIHGDDNSIQQYKDIFPVGFCDRRA